MLSSRIARYALGGVVVIVLLLGAWTAWQAWQVNKDLTEAVDRADAVKAAVQAGDQPRLVKEIKALQAASGAAADRTSGVTWSALSKLPMVGDDAEGVKVTAQVLDDLAADGVAPLAEVSDRLDDLLPRDGAVDVEVVQALQDPIARAQRAFAAADAALGGQDPSKFVGRLRTRFIDFADQVATADRAMTSARTTAEILPTMLGADGPRNYLVVFQGNSEIRGLGGLAGAVSLLHADDGRLELTRQVTGGSLRPVDGPLIPETEAEKALYEGRLSNYFANATLTPDVPRAAEFMRADWDAIYPNDPVDGVILLDTVALSYVVDRIGPLTVDGRELTGANLVEELNHTTYLRFIDPMKQDAFFSDVASAAFAKFIGGADDGVGLIQALSRSVDERRVYLHSFDDEIQQKIADTAIAGEFVTDPAAKSPQIQVTLNDGTGAKMSYFLRYDAEVDATYCTGGVQGYSAKLRLQSVAPNDAAELPDYITGAGIHGTDPGTQVVTVRIFGPVSGSIDGFQLNGEPMDLIEVDQDGRPVGMTYIQLEPGNTDDLAWTMKSGPGQTSAADFSVTPTIESKDNATTVASAC